MSRKFYNILKLYYFSLQIICSAYMEWWSVGVLVLIPLTPSLQFSTTPIGAKPLSSELETILTSFDLDKWWKWL
jgi:hypothetical protein